MFSEQSSRQIAALQSRQYLGRTFLSSVKKGKGDGHGQFSSEFRHP